MGDKYLSNVIDYERDMKNHNFIAIYSGVGSGKNRFIDSFYKKDPDIPNPQMTVLLITSRKAKVDEILDGNDCDIRGKIGKWGNLHDVKKETESEEEFRKKYKENLRVIERDNQKHFVYQKSVACTNAFIEKYLQYIYDPNDVTTHLWELFDMIVVDEVHSLILDASYQTAPFYVNDLIREYLWRCEQGNKDFHLYPKCKHLVIMTGTPEHVKELSVVWKYDLHSIDKRKECFNVMPKNIHFINRANVLKQLQKKLKDGERSIYFAQTITRIENYYDRLQVEDKSAIAQSFSKEEKRKAVPEDVRVVMEATEKRIKEEGLLPDTVQLLLSTERLKEGINIYNKDIENIYVESKHLGDIIQMAGRVRAGAKNMYVVLDGGLNTEDVLESYDAIFSSKQLVGYKEGRKALTDFWQEECIAHGSDLFNNRYSTKAVRDANWSSEFVKYVHEKFPYIRYSYFRNCFEFYENCYNGKWDYGSAELNWNHAIENGKITQIFKKYFPESIVHSCKANIKNREINSIKIEKAEKYISDNMHNGEKYSFIQCEKFLKDLNNILDTEYNSLHFVFRKLNMPCQMKKVTKTGKVSKKKIQEHEKDKKLFLFTWDN